MGTIAEPWEDPQIDELITEDDDLIDEVEKTVDKTNKQNAGLHSAQIMKAGYPIQLSLLISGRTPFVTVKKENGSHVFRFKRSSFASIYFLATSTIFGVVFFMSVIGYITMYLGISTSAVTNRCQKTWENFNLKRTTVPTALTVSWLYLTLVGSYVIFTRGREYIHYLNFWNRAVAVMDIDPTDGARRTGLLDLSLFGILVSLFILLYATGVVPSLHEGAASISNSIVRLFIKDIGVSDKFNEQVSLQTGTSCTHERNKKWLSPLDYENISIKGWKMMGFFIQIYAIYGSWSFVIQFRFYCRMLRNISFVWNERFKNALHGVPENDEDQTTRRLQLKLILKDHLIVVQMYKLTESAFSTVLNSFYAVQIVNLCCELYFLSEMQGSSSCDKMLLQLGDDLTQGVMKICLGIPATKDISEILHPGNGSATDTIKWFDDPCAPPESALLHEALVAIALLIQTLRITFSTTLEAALSYEEAMRGFSILRRHGYMYCRNRRERNFMHSLIFSFARNNPIQITAGKYFVVNRTLITVISGAIFTYYIILLQFKPGEFDTKNYCIEKICTDTELASNRLVTDEIRNSCSILRVNVTN